MFVDDYHAAGCVPNTVNCWLEAIFMVGSIRIISIYEIVNYKALCVTNLFVA